MLFAYSFLVTLNKQVATARNNSVGLKFTTSGYQDLQYVTEFILVIWCNHTSIAVSLRKISVGDPVQVP